MSPLRYFQSFGMIAIRPPILLYVARAARLWQAALARKRSMPRQARMLLLDGKIEAAAGTVVGAQDQHHRFVADRAAQRFLVVYQRHGKMCIRDRCIIVLQEIPAGLSELWLSAYHNEGKQYP